MATKGRTAWEWRQVADEELERQAREKGYRLAPKDVRERLMANPKVRAGLDAYFERYKRHNGNVPTISAEEAARQLDELMAESPDV